MLPNINSKKRTIIPNKGSHSIASRKHNEFSDIIRWLRVHCISTLQTMELVHKPNPASTKMCICSSLELIDKIIKRTEIFFNSCQKLSRRLPPSIRLHGLPEEFMVPSLGCIVESRKWVALVICNAHYILQRLFI
uniref:Uncharacterized protein n=1 Tax=Opuntia streptacantha TaxID=393608 RepID=A0A7C8ZIG2_OPUST